MSEIPDIELFTPRLCVRLPREGDGEAFLRAAKRSRDLHGPWVTPPADAAAFAVWRARLGPTFVPLVAVDRETGEPAAVVNVSQIVRGVFRSAYLGYYALEPYAGTGRMGEALGAVVRYALGPFGLHRLEANIRPENEASVRLVKRCGFEREGYSPAYLFLDGVWRDHERWAIRAELLDG